MIKKCLSKKIVSLCLLFIMSVTFFSCRIDETGVVSDGSYERCLTGKIDNFDVLRTIASEVPTEEYDYYLYGITNLYEEFQITKMTVNEAGIFTTYLEPCYWDLTLFAVEKGRSIDFTPAYIKDNASLMARAVADLTYDSSPVTFSLSVYGLTSPGILDFDIFLTNDGTDAGRWNFQDLNTIITASIEDTVYGHEVKFSDLSSSEKNLTFSNSKVHYNGSIAPGTYNFVVRFIDSTTGDITAEWSDVLIVLSGRKIKSNVCIPDVIGRKPDAPEFFYATYIKGSEDQHDDTGNHNDYYKVHFSWANTPVNERYYEIRLADISGTINGILDWDSVVPSKKIVYGRDFVSRFERVDGSLEANNTSITLWLPLGVQYKAQIRSVGSYYASDWVDVTMPSSGVDYDDGEISYFNSMTINRGRIRYVLNGGTYNKTDAFVETKIVDQYFTQNNPVEFGGTVAVPLWNGEGFDSSSELDDLKRKNDSGSYDKFRYWCTDPSNMSGNRFYDVKNEITPNNSGYYDYKHIVLYADYEANVADVSVSQEYMLCASWFKYSIDGTPAGNVISTSKTDRIVSLIIDRASVVEDASGSKRLRFSLNIPEDVDSDAPGIQSLPSQYDSVEMTVYDSEGKIVMNHNCMALASFGFDTDFTPINLDTHGNSFFKVIFNAKKALSGLTSSNEVEVMVILK